MLKLIQPHLREGLSLFSDLPGHQAPHGGTIPPHIYVTALKPDIFVADTRPISHRVGRSVGLSVGPSVRRSVTLCFLCIFGHFKV